MRLNNLIPSISLNILIVGLLFIPMLAFISCTTVKPKLTPQQEANILYSDASRLQDEELYEEANVQFEEYIKKFPESTRADNAQLEIGRGYFLQGKYDEAISAYTEVINKYPNSDSADQAMLFIGDTYVAQDKYESALENYQKIIQKYPRLGVKVAIDAKNRIEAVKDLQDDMKILSEGSDDSKDNAQYDIGEIFFTVFNDYGRALTEYQKVMDRWPKSELADNALFRVGECYWNIASSQPPVLKLTDEFKAYVRLMEIYERFPQLTKIKLFHIDAHWPAATKDPHEYEYLFAETRRIINKYPNIQERQEIDFISEDYKKAVEKWREVLLTYPNSDGANEATLRIARAYVDLGNLYYNIGQRRFASLFFRESLTTFPTPEAHLGMARYYGNITSISAPAWAYRRAFYHIREASKLTPPNSPMADTVSWAKEWMNYKMRIEGLENWPDKNTKRR